MLLTCAARSSLHHNIFRGCAIKPYTEELLSSLNQQKARKLRREV